MGFFTAFNTDLQRIGNKQYTNILQEDFGRF